MNQSNSNSNNQRSRSSQSPGGQNSQGGFNPQANYGPHTGYSQTSQTHAGYYVGQQVSHTPQQGWHGQAHPARFYHAQQLPRIPNYTAEDYPFPTGLPHDPALKMYPMRNYTGDDGELSAAATQWDAAVKEDRAKAAAAAQRQAQGQAQRSATPNSSSRSQSGNNSTASKAQPKKK
ncbi:hypothetical protein AAF712_000038 [Marasmius tenuissimus]|uniref:Uncharacterized protein n=1 Tax=Marasmius tenuissimus TaxID=585030 RepID=A0ABR3AEC2_9AGAR|nr:hypothetical protein PM082_000750 [Marasmius tenuissimus]